MRVVGTAGHVDHGKSTLIHALTGIDPDRLQEEKERGMTIDLGFAWLQLPNGAEVSIVDVPGHERFIHNMLAGVGGIDVALLVVAADEGVMPQTREHLAILDLLGDLERRDRADQTRSGRRRVARPGRRPTSRSFSSGHVLARCARSCACSADDGRGARRAQAHARGAAEPRAQHGRAPVGRDCRSIASSPWPGSGRS